MRNFFLRRTSDKKLSKKKRGIYANESKLVTELKVFWDRRKMVKKLIRAYNECQNLKYNRMKRLMPGLSVEHSMSYSLSKVNETLLSESERSLYTQLRETFKQITDQGKLRPMLMRELDVTEIKQNIVKINTHYAMLDKLESKIKKLEVHPESHYENEQLRRAREQTLTDICGISDHLLNALLVQNAKPLLYQVLREIHNNYSTMIGTIQKIIFSSGSSNNRFSSSEEKFKPAPNKYKSPAYHGESVESPALHQAQPSAKVKNAAQSKNSISSVKSSDTDNMPVKSPDYFVALCDYEGDSSNISLHEGQKYPIIKTGHGGKLLAKSKSHKQGHVKEELVEFF